MKRLLAGALVSVFCLGIAGSTPTHVEADGLKCNVFHKGRVISVSLAAVPAHLAHGDKAKCLIDIPK